jgi:hypothetical protein
MSELPAPPPAAEYTVRRFTPPDAPGVTRLIELVYGNSYYPRDLYEPMQIVRLNVAEQLVSVLALAADEVVGHYALERPNLGAVAEASDAVVHPEYRHHHLMEQMRLVLRREAERLGLTGLVGYPVTNHLFSQKADEHIGAHPCGVALGLWPSSFHNMPEPLPQRMSFVVYFRFLRPPGEAVHVATRHHEVCERICRQYGVPVRPCEAAPPEGAGHLAVEHEPEVQTGTIRVHRVGADSATAVRAARAKLCDGFGARALTLELPLCQPGTAEVCRAAEEDGFFFSGLGPAFAADGDALLLQYVVEDLDLSLVQIESPFANELFGYVSREWQRARGASGPDRPSPQ